MTTLDDPPAPTTHPPPPPATGAAPRRPAEPDVPPIPTSRLPHPRGVPARYHDTFAAVLNAIPRHLTVSGTIMPSESPSPIPHGRTLPRSSTPPPPNTPDPDAPPASLIPHPSSLIPAVPLVPYPEQLLAGASLLHGEVAEMATGEGKTIAAAFAAACQAHEGPVHVATANAYLAARDAALLAPVYAEVGLTTGVITPDSNASERRTAYGRDIVYSTLSELGFDYLRDRLALRATDRVQVRGLGALIVDEADLLMIDEARTPLLIARAAPEDAGPDLVALAPIVEEIVEQQAVRVAAKLDLLRTLPPNSFDAAVVTAQVRRGAPRDLAVLSWFTDHPRAARTAERTERELRGRGGWMLDDGLLFSIDERARTAYFTEDGQAALEARLGPIFTREDADKSTLAALHSLLLAYALFRRDRDYLIRDGRVVLIEESTGRAAESRRYQHGLHAAIEVKELGTPDLNTETLAQISVQQFVRQYARRSGMTGTASSAAEEFARIYEMRVRRIPRHRPNRRIDLPPRLYRTAAEADRAIADETAEAHAAGRPVLIGTQDVARSERLSALLTERGLPHAVLNAREHQREAQIIANAGRTGAITIATNMAGRGTDIVLAPSPLPPSPVATGEGDTAGDQGALLGHVAQVSFSTEPTVSPDPPLPSQRGRGLGGGGLLVLAAEPAPNRRLDDQLRGRGGRQGDPGSSRLYASVEDETIRFYGAEHVRAGALKALRDRPYLEGKRAQRVIDDAQRRAERLHQGQRSTLFEFDQVIERQRKAMLAGYERAIAHPSPDDAVRAFISEVAAGEVARRPKDAAGTAAWAAELRQRYGLPGDTNVAVTTDTLTAMLEDRYRRARTEAGAAWPEMARAALLRVAAELWSLHVDAIDKLQRQSPGLYAFLPGPATIPFAKEASRRYAEYLWMVKAATLSELLTLPQTYERAMPAGVTPAVSGALDQLLGRVGTGTTGAGRVE